MRYKANRLALDWLLIVIISIFFGWLTGRNLEDSKSSEIIATFSISTADSAKVYFELENETGVLGAVHLALNKNGDVLNQSFPKSRKVDRFFISVETDAEIQIAGLGINRGSFLKTFTPSEIVESFEISGVDSYIVEGRYLNLIPEDGKKAQLSLKQPLDLNVVSMHWKLFVIGTIIAFIIIAIIYKLRFAGTKKFASTWLLSFAMLFALVSVLNNLKEPLNSAEVYIKYNADELDKNPFEIRFSRTAMFTPMDTLSSGKMEDESTIKMKFLPGIHRHMRVDFPANDTVRIDELRFEFLFFNKSIGGKDLLAYFPFRNDVDINYDSVGTPIFITGNSNPYIQLANDEMQDRYVIGQKKKREYPFFFGVIGFFGFLVLFSVPLAMDKKLFIAVFIAFLIMPITLHFVKYDRLHLQVEKRVAQTPPDFNQDFETVVDETDAYLQDHFGIRRALITQWNMIKIKLFNQTDKSSVVLLGRDKWLFYNAEGARELFENKTLHSKEELELILHNVKERKAWLDMYGIDFYIVIPPLKQTIYPEFYPKNFRKRDGLTKREQLVDHLRKNSDVKILDLTQTIKEVKEKEDRLIYYTSDTHWNKIGGLYGYMKIMDEIGKDHPEVGDPVTIKDFNWTQIEDFEGDLAKMLSLDDYFPRSVYLAEPKTALQANQIPSVSYPDLKSMREPLTFIHPDTTKLKLVMNRDSYTNYMYPQMSEHFSRSVYIWSRHFNAKAIKIEQPDIVVTEMVERIIMDLSLENPPIMRHELDSAAAARAISDTTLTSF